MEQNHSEPPTPAPYGRDQALARGIRESRLDAVGSGVAEDQERVVVVEIQLAALDRERKDRAARADDTRQERFLQEQVGDQGEVLRARVVPLVDDPRDAREAGAT